MNVYEIALGALLHDIGKFMQRAHAPGKGLGEQSRRMAEYICPVYHGQSSHQHVLYTNEFVEAMPWLPEDIRQAAAANLASYHHRPSTPEQELITEADRLSSSMDREEGDADTGDARTRFRKVRLVSIAAVAGRPEADPSKAPAFGLAPLTPEDSYPTRFSEESNLTDDYAALWRSFVADWRQNRCPDAFGFLARALSILERHTWCIPSATNALPDISLYDHLKTTAAIAVCLAAPDKDPQNPFLLVAGDLTGIQNYLFDLRGKDSPARRLRARSFHVLAYGQSVVLGILTRLGLPPTQIILSAGGKFHLLLPNTPETQQVLNRIRRDASGWLMKNSTGDLALALAALPCSREGLDNFSTTLEQLHQALRDIRDRAGDAQLIGDDGWNEEAFVLPPFEALDGPCEYCRRRGATWITDEDGKEKLKCAVCREEEKAGQRLTKTRYAAFYTDDYGQFSAPCGSYSLVADDRKIHGRPVWVVDLDGDEHGAVPDTWPLFVQPWARHAPRKEENTPDGDLLSFPEIAEKSEGRPALAWLKMDVDDLGWIFAHGLKRPEQKQISISRITTLSRTLEGFFRARLQQLLRQEFYYTYLVYAGGDDVLALGPWDKIIALAARIRTEFHEFTGRNPAFTLSAGIALAGDHTPVLTAAAQADARLEGAKNIPGDGPLPWPCFGGDPDAPPKKDRITVFGVSIPGNDFPKAIERAEELRNWIRDKTISTGKARRLLQCAELHRRFQQTGDTAYLRYVPMLVYDLKRNWNENTPPEQAAKEWAADLITPASKEMNILRFLCEFALYGVRGKNKEE